MCLVESFNLLCQHLWFQSKRSERKVEDDGEEKQWKRMRCVDILANHTLVCLSPGKRAQHVNISTPPISPSLFSNPAITEEFARDQLKQLRSNKAIGLDNISARLLKDSASVIGKSRTKLFNQSLLTRTPSKQTMAVIQTTSGQ